MHNYTTNHLPQFTEFTCTDLPDPTNGIVTFSTDTVAPFSLKTRATYSCDQGYGLSGGNTVRTCGPNADNTNPEGVWSGNVPACHCKCLPMCIRCIIL